MHQCDLEQILLWMLIVPKPNTQVKVDKNELISEHESEYVRYSQSIDSEAHQVEEEKKLQYSDSSSYKSISSTSDIHGEGEGCNSEEENDIDVVQEVRDITDLNEHEVRELLRSFYESNLTESEVLNKKIKGLAKTTIYRVYKRLRETGTIDRQLGSGRKNIINETSLDKIKQILKEDNTL